MLVDVILIVFFFIIFYRINLPLRVRNDGFFDFVTSQGLRFKYAYLRGGFYRNDDVLISCDTACDFQFLMRPERWYDRLSKKIKISSEVQIGDKKFDDSFYLMFGDDDVYAAMRSSALIEQKVYEILTLCSENLLIFRAIGFANGRAWVEVRDARRKFYTLLPRAEEIAEKLLPALNAISDEFFKIVPTKKISARRNADVESVITAIIFSSLAAGSISIIAHDFSGYFPQIVRVDNILLDSFLIAAATVVATIISTIILLIGSSRTHVLLAKVAFLGFIGYSCICAILVRDINIEFDNSRETLLDAVIVSKKYGGRRASSLYLSNNYRLDVGQSAYYNVRVGDNVCIKEKSGRLGYKFIAEAYSTKCEFVH